MLRTGLAVGLGLAFTLCVAPSAFATTEGNTGGLAGPAEVLQVMINGGPLVDAKGNAITFTNALYSYIKNDYIGVVLGYDGTYNTPVDAANDTVEHHSAGMLTFGNQKGSLLTSYDDDQALCGLNSFEIPNNATPPGPLGYGVWPLPGWAEYGTGVVYIDNSAYTRANVDGTLINIVGSDTTTDLVEPRFENNTLQARYQLLAGTGTGNGGSGVGINGMPPITGDVVTLDQVIELYRSVARVHWHLYNGDSAAHTITLRFEAPIRDNAYALFMGPDSFYYVDPQQGPTTQTSTLTGATIPSTLYVYGNRYDDPTNTTVAPFAQRTILQGYNATLPTEVLIADPFDYRPNGTGFYPGDVTNLHTTLEEGIAEVLYYGPYTLQPGATQDIYFFYGNGRPTEDLQDDVVVGTEATEAVTYNTAAASDPKLVDNLQVVTDPTQLAYAEQDFLLPNPLQIQSSVYNRTTAQNGLPLTGVTMSVILPASGLAFADPPGSTTVDTATKTVGEVAQDTDASKSWYIEATGTAIGVLSYQLAATSNEIGSRTVTRTISIPASPLHPVTNTSFQMLGFPFQFDQAATNNGDPATIINTLSPPSLQDNPAIFYYWVPSTDSLGNVSGKYEIATSLTPGQGYFFRPASTRNLFVYGAAPIPGQTPTTSSSSGQTGQVQLKLSAGWNMITNPYVYSVPLEELKVSPDIAGTLSNSASPFLTAATSGLVEGTLYYYDVSSGEYDYFDFEADQPTPTLDPWVGYWVYAFENIYLTFPLPTIHNSYVVPSASATSTKGVIARGAAMVKAPTVNNWTLQLTALKSNGTGDHAAIIGVQSGVTSKNATLAKPPTPASDYVYIGLTSPIGKPNVRYTEVLQAPSAASKTWDFEVSSDATGNVTLGWPNVATLPRTLGLTLKNLATGTSTSLRGRSSVQVALKAGQVSKFEIVASQLDSAPLAINSVRVIKSGTTRAAGASANVVYSLTQAATVTVVVENQRKKVVSTVYSGRSATVGQNTLSWTGLNSSGAALPAGLYYIKIEARSESGETAVVETPFLSLR